MTSTIVRDPFRDPRVGDQFACLSPISGEWSPWVVVGRTAKEVVVAFPSARESQGAVSPEWSMPMTTWELNTANRKSIEILRLNAIEVPILEGSQK